MSSLCSKIDITVDSWNLILSKTYVASVELRGGPYKKENVATHFQIAKRIYKCKEATDLKKEHRMLCAPGRNATGKVLKRGDIENVPSGSHVPNINQSYEISRQLNKGTANPLKKLIEKQ